MGNLSCSRRNSRVSQNPGPASGGPPPPSRVVPVPPHYLAGHSAFPPLPENYPLPYYHYPPPYNNGVGGSNPAPQYFPYNIMQTNGQYLMNLPLVQMYRTPPYAPPPLPPQRVLEVPEHQEPDIINNVNLKKATLRLEKDEKNPGYYVVAFTFDALVAGSICIFFLAKEGVSSSVTSTKPHIYTPLRTKFEKGMGQKFKQDPETGVMLALFDDEELLKGGGEDNVFPLLIRMETVPQTPLLGEPSRDAEPLGAALPKWVHSQITQAVIEKKDDETYQVRVVKQIIWVEGVRYELQEIYGKYDTDEGKECFVCMSEPRDTVVLPCRHMCMCSECAKVIRFQTNRCPICRTPVERLLEIKVRPKNGVQLHNTKKRLQRCCEVQ